MKGFITVMMIGAVLMLTGEVIGFFVSVRWGGVLLLVGGGVFLLPMVVVGLAFERLRRERRIAGRHKR